MRERLHAQRMLALDRSGRQAEALEAYRDARAALVELGIEPGEELRALHQAILEHDPGIAAPPAPATSVPEREDAEAPTGPGHGRRRALSRRALLIAAGALAAVTAGVAAFWPDGATEVAAVRSNVVAEIDPGDGSLGGQVELGGPPSAIAVGPDAIWVADDRDGTVSRIDPKRTRSGTRSGWGTARARWPPTAAASGPPTVTTAG